MMLEQVWVVYWVAQRDVCWVLRSGLRSGLHSLAGTTTLASDTTVHLAPVHLAMLAFQFEFD